MVLVAGVVIGSVLGFGVATVLRRRRPGSSPAEPRGLAIAVAVAALLVAALALANSDRDHTDVATPPAAGGTTTTTATAVPASSSTTAPRGPVNVPNVVGLAREAAVNAIQDAGLRVSIETLSLANVPAGFVIQQNPLPFATAPGGSTVALTVSSAA